MQEVHDEQNVRLLGIEHMPGLGWGSETFTLRVMQVTDRIWSLFESLTFCSWEGGVCEAPCWARGWAFSSGPSFVLQPCDDFLAEFVSYLHNTFSFA